MAFLDPNEAFEHFSSRTSEAISSQFPIKGKTHTVVLKKIEIKNPHHPDDLRSQFKAKVEGGSFVAPLYGHLELVDNATGKVLDSRKMRLAEIPVPTQRYSYIVEGSEYQVDNQWQLKPGAYVRRRPNGELETQFNVKGASTFDVTFDDKKKQFLLEYGKSKLPLYPFMRAMGVGDEEMERTWGKEIFAANKGARGASGALLRFHKSLTKRDAATEEEAMENLRQVMQNSKLRKDSTEITLGKPFEHVTGEAMHLATQKMLKVQAGHPEDDRDSLLFKDFRSAGDYAHDKISASRRTIQQKVLRNLGNTEHLGDIIKFGFFNDAVKKSLTDNAASRFATQINPVEMISSVSQTTIMGSGGIQSDQQITENAKMLNPTHFGFLDPLNTPEGGRTGVTLRLPLGVRKIGNDPMMPLFNLKTGKMEMVTPSTFFKSKVVLADQVTWKDGKPVPVSDKVMVVGHQNKFEQVPFGQAEYAMKHNSQMLNLTSNLVPFVANDSGGRVSMATRHMEQAISLANRQQPLVQVGTGAHVPGGHTFEQVVGNHASHSAPVAGVVHQVKEDAIVIKDAQGKTHEVQIYNNYPLNDAKGVFHSIPTVKPGDKVKAGQLIADSNFTKNGTLALGTNLRVAYMTMKGYNFEDGVVISESAAKNKLASFHLHKHFLPVDDTTVFGAKKFRIQHPGVYKPDQFGHLDEQGVAKVGSIVKPGDPLVLAMKPFELSDRVELARIRKSLSGGHADKSMRWDGETPGEVVSVTRGKNGLQVHVRTLEPMQVGDKCCFDEKTEALTSRGWVPVADLRIEDEICCLVDGEIVYQAPEELQAYAHGGRMYRIQSSQVDLFVTTEHKMYVQGRGETSFSLKPANDLVGKRVSYKKDGIWRGTPAPDLVLPAQTYSLGAKGHRTLPEVRLSGRVYAMLLGAFLSEGSCVNDPSTGSYGIDIAQVKPHGREELFTALDAAGLHYTKTPDRARIYSKQLFLHFKRFGHARDKYIPADVFTWHIDDLRVLFHWLMWGDGHTENGQPKVYTTTSKQLADDVQRLALHIGKAANIRVLPEHTFEQNGREYLARTRYDVHIVNTKLTPTVNHGHAKRQKVQREEIVEDYGGPVYCVTVPGHVLYVRRNGKPCWSGNSNRHGAKGIISAILPDHEMPHDKDGKPVEMIQNFTGIPSRMNPGQLFEAAAAKIALKTGQPYVVNNFPHGMDMARHIQEELKKHGLSDTEELIDPITKKSYGQVMVGHPHIFKLVHQVDKKVAISPGMGLPGMAGGDRYDLNLQPAKGQRVGALGIYALLAHGANANLREMATWKGEGEDPQPNPGKRWQSQHLQVWNAIQTGAPLPTPKSTFAFKKFSDMLKGAGVNIEKKGHEFILSPLTDKHILELSENRSIPKPAERLEARADSTGELKVRPGGLFDEKLTGGHGGTKWAHIELAEPVPNPLFEAPIRALTGLTKKDFHDVVHGHKGITMSGQLTDTKNAHYLGGEAIQKMLQKVDVPTALAKAEADLKKAKPLDVDPMMKKVKYLRALDQMGMKPHEAYVLTKMPVIPPVLRPASLMSDGNVKYADINELYKDFALINSQLQDPVLRKHLPEEKKTELRQSYYDGVKAVFGFGIPYAEAKNKGLLHQIAGSSPKLGFFQQRVVQKRQDLTMRSTIVPEPALGLDEVGLPKQHAVELFRVFLVKKLQDMGAAKTPLEAQKLLTNPHTPTVSRALEQVMAERPVLLKRDPALHKYSIQGFQPRVVEGNAIRIHPLVCGGFNADFDGDSVDLDTPILLRIEGQVTYRTGRQLAQLLDAGPGNYVLQTRNIEAYTYEGWRPVKTVSFHEVLDKKKYRVTLRNGVSFIVSEDHSLMVNRKEVKPGELNVGTALDHVKPSSPVGRKSYELGVLYGNFLGDGCAELRRQGGGRVAIACLPEVERTYLMEHWRKEFPGVNPSSYKYGFHVNGVALAKHFLEVCGRYCDGKFLGDELYNNGSEFLAGLLAGYILADGSVESTKSGSFLVRTWSRSKAIRDGMSLVALMLGLPHTLRERVAKGKVNYLISFGKKAISLLDYRCPGKKGELLRLARRDYATARKDARRSQDAHDFEITAIEEVEYTERMIDLEVEDQHVFTILGGVVLHNTMSVFVPISRHAVDEAHKMKPTANLFSEASGSIAYSPTLESALGLYKMSLMGKETGKSFASSQEAIQAAKDGKIHPTDVVSIGGKKTTAARAMLANALPAPMQQDILYKPDFKLNKSGLSKLLTTLGKNHQPEFDKSINALKDLGNGASTGVFFPDGPNKVKDVFTNPQKAAVSFGAHTLSIKDFEVDKATRDPILHAADKAADAIRASKTIPEKDKDRQVIEVYSKADAQIAATHKELANKNPNRLFEMHQAGIKPSWDNYKQMRLAPVLMLDSMNRVVPTPVKKGYGEGMDMAGYWIQMMGARRGTVMKVQEVQEPGYLTKLLQANVMDTKVVGHDCGTKTGVSRPIHESDVVDRVLLADVKAGPLHLKAGTTLTADVVDKLRATDKNLQVQVRSPLHCEHGKGVCQKCAGLNANGQFHPVGTNIGVLSAHAVGERAVQLTMKEFHQGGVVGGSSSTVSGFSRFQQLTMLPGKIPNAASLAHATGKIQKIEETSTGARITINGKAHEIGRDVTGMPLHTLLPNQTNSKGWSPPKVGDHVEAGQMLTDPHRTMINTHDLYKATGSIETVRAHLTDEIHELYKGEGVKRQHVETLVRGMSDSTKIVDPGAAHDVLRGEFRSLSEIQKLNRELQAAGKDPVKHTPVLQGVAVAPLYAQQDWMGKLQHKHLRQTISEAAAVRSKSNIHGMHPVPAIAYGAEFGLNRSNSKTPGLQHLGDVPEHHFL